MAEMLIVIPSSLIANQVSINVDEESLFKPWHADILSLRTQRSTGLSKKIPAKFGDTCSVRADWLCIGCLGQWAERGREDSNMHEFFCTTLYVSKKGRFNYAERSFNRGPAARYFTSRQNTFNTRI